MLIAIISESFAAVVESAVQTGYYEKAIQSVSIMHTFNATSKSDPSELLFIARETFLEDDDDTNADVKEKIDKLAMHENAFKQYVDDTGTDGNIIFC